MFGAKGLSPDVRKDEHGYSKAVLHKCPQGLPLCSVLWGLGTGRSTTRFSVWEQQDSRGNTSLQSRC